MSDATLSISALGSVCTPMLPTSALIAEIVSGDRPSDPAMPAPPKSTRAASPPEIAGAGRPITIIYIIRGRRGGPAGVRPGQGYPDDRRGRSFGCIAEPGSGTGYGTTLSCSLGSVRASTPVHATVA